MNKKLLFTRLALLVFSLVLLWPLIDLRIVIDCIASIPLSVIILLILVSLFQTWMAAIRWQCLHPTESKQLSSWQYFAWRPALRWIEVAK